MKKIISIVLLLVTIFAFASCKQEMETPEGMKVLSVNDDYIVYVPEHWVVDDSKLSYAHSSNYSANDKKVFFASVQVSKYDLKDGETLEIFAENYVKSLESEFGGKFEKEQFFDYKKGEEKVGITFEYSIIKSDARECYKTTFIKKDAKIIEIKYIADEIDQLFKDNIADYNKIVENIYLK